MIPAYQKPFMKNNDFYEKELLPPKTNGSNLNVSLPLNGTASTKGNGFHLKKCLREVGMFSTKRNDWETVSNKKGRFPVKLIASTKRNAARDYKLKVNYKV